MRKLVVLTVVLLVAAVTNGKAQNLNLQNTSWKMYFDQLHDTLTMHLGKDSSFVTDSGGEVVVKSTFKVAKDTLDIRDYEGRYQCPGDEGIYKVTIVDGALNFTLISDPCEGRNGSLSGSKWIKAK
jgi:hypothetical protein